MFSELLNHLCVTLDEHNCPSVLLSSFEHQDYIDDVLTEKFDLFCKWKTVDDEKGAYILHFDEHIPIDALEKAISEINQFHENYSKIIDTI